MLLELIRRLFGYVRFCIIGRTPEAFLNAAALQGIPVWRVSARGEVCTAHTAAADYARLRPAARAGGVRLRVEQKNGLPFWMLHIRRRPGIAVGLLIFFTAPVFLSGFVWQVDANGTETVPAERVVQVAAACGVRPGVRIRSVDAEQVRLVLLTQLPELSWTAVNRVGSCYRIEVRARSAQPELIDETTPCNLKARCGGVIVRVQAEDGFAVVKPGDVVQAGDLLAEGLRPDAAGGTVLHHAHGKVIALTAHTFQSRQPLIRTVRLPTGRTVQRRRLCAFGVELPLSLQPAPGYAEYDRAVQTQPLTLFGIALPLSVSAETWTEQCSSQQTRDSSEAQQAGALELEQKIASELADAEIVSRRDETVTRGGTVIVTVTVTCLEDISCPEPIYWSE